MMHRRRLSHFTTLAAILLVPSLAALAACGSGSAQGPDPDAEYAAIIDVRTPGEYAGEHVAGAVNIDVQSASFAADIAALPTDGTYVVYCRSGNRSAQATRTMTSAGLDVIDGGGLGDMRSAGFEVTSA